MADFHKGQIGARLVVTIKEKGSAFDLSSATTLELHYKRRDGGTTKIFTASVANPPQGNGSGTDGKLEYTTTASTDLDEAGTWDAWPYIVTTNHNGFSQKVTFTVADTP